MKCFALVLDRNRGKLYKKADYEASVVTVKRGWRKEKLKGFLPDNAKPIEIETRRGTMPLWIVNRQTLVALTPEVIEHKGKTFKLATKANGGEASCVVEVKLVEKSNIDADTKMNLLTKREFWKQVAQKIKLTPMEILIYLGAGYGFFRLAEYSILAIFGV